MSDNKNVELNDEMMESAAGGKNDSIDISFNIGDRVTWSTNGGWSFGTIVAWSIVGFSFKVQVDPGYPNGGELIVKHASNLYPVDMK